MNKIMKTLPLTVGWILVYVVVILAVFIALDARIQVLRLQKLVGTPSVETPSTNLIPQQEQLKKLSERITQFETRLSELTGHNRPAPEKLAPENRAVIQSAATLAARLKVLEARIAEMEKMLKSGARGAGDSN